MSFEEFAGSKNPTKSRIMYHIQDLNDTCWMKSPVYISESSKGFILFCLAGPYVHLFSPESQYLQSFVEPRKFGSLESSPSLSILFGDACNNVGEVSFDVRDEPWTSSIILTVWITRFRGENPPLVTFHLQCQQISAKFGRIGGNP